MTSLNVSLSDSMKSYVDERVSSGDFATPAEFIRALIKQDRERRLSAIEAELLEALAGKEFSVSAEELKNGSLVSVLREKLARL